MAIWLCAPEEFADNCFQLLFIYTSILKISIPFPLKRKQTSILKISIKISKDLGMSEKA